MQPFLLSGVDRLNADVAFALVLLAEAARVPGAAERRHRPALVLQCAVVGVFRVTLG